MKKFPRPLLILLPILLCSGCGTGYLSRAMDEAKSFSNYVASKSRSIWNSDSESRLVSSNRQFYGEAEEEFIPLSDRDIHTETIEYTVPQAKEVPGDPEGHIPGIEAFHSPSKSLSSLFQKIYFNTDQYSPKSKESFQVLERMAYYLKKHRDVYIFVEGHCDERASEAYNLALGTRRANHIRKLLTQHGVSPDQIFTVSYGKERPENIGHGEKAWSKNRRVAFRIYSKREAL